MPTCDRCEIGERQSGYRSVSFSAFSQFTDNVLLHIRFTLRRRGITVPRNSLTRYTAWHLRIKRLVQFIFAGSVHYNVLTTCATLLCRACLDEITCVAVMYLTLRTGCERHARVTRLPRPFPAYAVYHLHPSYPNKGKVGVQRGRKTAGCPSFLPPRRAPHSPALRRAQLPAASQRKTLRPLG